MKALPYIDRLAQTQWFERFGFIAVALGGCIAIVLGKVIGVPSLVVTGVAVAIMLVYAAIMWRAIAGRVRADQAGDNLYYLGLLYTLSGLAYAIFTFRPEASSNAIVEGFGIALATTIVGLMLRVFFNQVRADLVEIEERARMDLAQAALELKAELNQVVVEMNDFGRQTRQSLAEAVSGVEAGMINSVKQAGDRLAKLTVTADEKVTLAFARLEDCADELVGSTKEASGAIAENAATVRDLSKTLAGASPNLTAFADATERTSAAAAAIPEQVESARRVQDAAAATGSELRTQVETVAALLSAMRTTIENSLATQEQRLKDLERAPMLAAEQVTRMLTDLQEQVQRDIAASAAANSDVINGQVEAVKNAVASLLELNGQLAAEVAKSQAHVATFHGGLVTVVQDLATHVNGSSARQ